MLQQRPRSLTYARPHLLNASLLLAALLLSCSGALDEGVARSALDCGSGSSGEDCGSGSDGSGSDEPGDGDGSGSGSGSNCYPGGNLPDGSGCFCDTDCAGERCDRFNTCRTCDQVYEYTSIDGYRANKAAYVPPGTFAPWLPVHSTMLLVIHESRWEEEWRAELDECHWVDRSPAPRCVQFVNHGTNALTPARNWQGQCAEAGSLCELAMTPPAGCTCEAVAAAAGENDGDPRNVCPGAQPSYRYGLSVSSIGGWAGSNEDADQLLSTIDGCDCDDLTPFLDEAYARSCIMDALACLGPITDAQAAEGFACMQDAAMSGSGSGSGSGDGDGSGSGSGSEPDTSGCPTTCNWLDAAASVIACIADTHVCNDDESLREHAFLNGSCPADRTDSCSGPDIFGYWP